jgi:para-nitrobenzyl esterase
VVDGAALPRHPFYPDAAPQSRAIPMMIGNTRDETRAFLGGDARNFTLTWEQLPSRLTLANLRVDIAPERVIAAYRGLYPHYSPSDVLFSATTASRSWRGAVIEAEERAKAGAPAYVYQLDWRSPREGGRHGAHHGLDIPLVFGTLDAAGDMTGAGAEARAVSDAMGDAFVSFARTGAPRYRGVASWTPYTMARRETLVIDAQARMADDPRGAERAFFAQVPYVQPGT